MGALQTNPVKRFRMHTVAVEIRGAPAPGLLEDFDFYTDRPAILDREEEFAVVLELVRRAPSANDLPARAATRGFSEGVLYREGAKLYYEYGDAVLAIDQQARASFARLITKDAGLAARIGRRFLQSELGRGLDLAGLHRVNGLGLGFPGGKGALLLLPPGVEKGSLALSLLRAGGMLLSEDSPLVDRFGRLLPYPLPLRFSSEAAVPEEWRDAVGASRAGELLLPATKLPSAYLPRPGERFRPSFLVVAARHGANRAASLAPLPRWKTSARLLKDLVAGLGLPGVEEGLPDLASVASLAPKSASRLAAAGALLARAETLSLTLSRDHEENARALLRAFGVEAHGKND
jgi:hypothetical protein